MATTKPFRLRACSRLSTTVLLVSSCFGEFSKARGYPWCSVAGGWALPPGKRPKWLAAEDGLKRFDLPDTARHMLDRFHTPKVAEAALSHSSTAVSELGTAWP